MLSFLKNWGIFILLVLFGEIAISSGSFAFSIKDNFQPNIPILVIETETGVEGFIKIDPDTLGAIAVSERIIKNHKFVIFGRIGGEWVLFQSKEAMKEAMKEETKKVIGGIFG